MAFSEAGFFEAQAGKQIATVRIRITFKSDDFRVEFIELALGEEWENLRRDFEQGLRSGAKGSDGLQGGDEIGQDRGEHAAMMRSPPVSSMRIVYKLSRTYETLTPRSLSLRCHMSQPQKHTTFRDVEFGFRV